MLNPSPKSVDPRITEQRLVTSRKNRAGCRSSAHKPSGSVRGPPAMLRRTGARPLGRLPQMAPVVQADHVPLARAGAHVAMHSGVVGLEEQPGLHAKNMRRPDIDDAAVAEDHHAL